ncbi:ankyrin repeat domain-containing protein [Erythrobacter donghaensis]|uniref:ankyrin repeat domain-containing protein n=1 Tax=Erythrobacter donghaensis TaxID=267135 RepID=UPI000A3889EF|nr:ankyrin repeat domain-containing protein [Erythrobacter donghaensis]
MTQVPDAAFPDPVVHQAAQAIVDGGGANEIARAAAAGKLDFAGPQNDTLLTLSVQGNKVEAVREILRRGANPNVPAERAPIAIAASGADFRIVQYLLEAGASPNGIVGSQSAIWRAASGGRRDVAEMLLDAGASIDAADANGDTPLSNAVQSGEFELAHYLLSRGASPFASDKSGVTIGFWLGFVRLDPTSEKGRARDRLIQVLKDRGHPWPPPGPDEVLAMKAAGQWPPR